LVAKVGEACDLLSRIWLRRPDNAGELRELGDHARGLRLVGSSGLGRRFARDLKILEQDREVLELLIRELDHGLLPVRPADSNRVA
jgi:hypothetical protein